jgi:hypothetical protein
LWVPDLLASQKLLLVGIANHDGDGGAWPTIATLEAYLNCKERRIQQLLAALVCAGYVTIEHNAGGNDRTRPDRRPNLYHLHLPVVDKSAHGVQHSAPGTGNGVQFSGSRGAILGADGVQHSAPKTSFMNRPIERAPGPVDNEQRCIKCGAVLDDTRRGKTRCAACQSETDELRARRIANEQEPTA